MSDHRVLTPSPAVVRASAVLAVAGGGLRVANSFTTDVLPGGTLALLYLATDVFLLAGIAGMWWRRRRSLGIAATIGIVVFVGGTLAIRVATLGVLGTAGYQIGATIALLGLAAYSIETLLQRGAAPWAPVSVARVAGLRDGGRGRRRTANPDHRGRGRVRCGIRRGGCRDARRSIRDRAGRTSVHSRHVGGREAPGRIIGGGRRHHVGTDVLIAPPARLARSTPARGTLPSQDPTLHPHERGPDP